MSEQPENSGIPARTPADDNTAEAMSEKRFWGKAMSADEASTELAKRTRRSFLVAAMASIAGGAGLRWLLRPQRQAVFDRVLGWNEKLGESLFRPQALAPEFPRRLAQIPRVNGTEGLSDGFDPVRWRLQVTGISNASGYPQFASDLIFDNEVESRLAEKFPSSPIEGLSLSLDDIRDLPRVEMITELKCIEGWSTIVSWAGARVADFIAKYPPLSAADTANSPLGDARKLPPYVSLVTPDRGYYVGWDTQSFVHPQTLLCYEMNGAPLTIPHGGPLRLVSTAKYGIKQIKRIGRISFTDQRPADFWAEQGYDWYSGL